ncbi:MAG TPA: CBS domain-containing protein, partial [Phaeodactylibacter sp.]|nr:CBS domain-containing protein [Phaeodactylibacter sp.]
RESVMELYREEVAMHKLLLKPKKMEDALKVLEEGRTPKLYSLSIHSGTIYRWNRACYGISPNGKPHLRIENRVLPAGPSTADETANAAFWLGMMLNMPPKYRRLWEKMDFDLAKGNFLRAARQGLGVYFSWPGLRKKISAPELIRKELLPIAREGLKKAKVAAKDIERYLGIIEERVRSGKTGSQWILDSFNSLRRQSSKDEAIVATTAALWKRQQSGKPVHEWEPAQLTEAGNWMNRFGTIQQIMSTDLITASENDLIDFVAQLMNWRNIRHLPIENDRGELVGLITSKQLVQHYSENCDRPDIRSAKDIMITKIVAVEPDTPTIEAVELMREHGFSCLPVLQDKKLFGIVTESDFVNMAAQVLKEWKE